VTDAAVEASALCRQPSRCTCRVKKDDPAREEKIRIFAMDFVERAWRCDFPEAERAEFMEERLAKGEKLDASVKRLVLLTLTSPRFLYRW